MTTFEISQSVRAHAHTEATIYADGTTLTADELFASWVAACEQAGELVSCQRVYAEMIRGHQAEISLREWDAIQDINYLWICGVGCPAGQEFRHNTDTDVDEDYCDFSELPILDKLWDLVGTVDENGTWVWNGKGTVLDDRGNTIYIVTTQSIDCLEPEDEEPEPLDLDAMFASSHWRFVDNIATYTACVYGANGDQPGEVEIVLQSAEEDDVTAYRWAERDDGGTHETGEITLDRDAAIAAGEEYASENDEEPDPEELIRQIVETGYFGDADAGDIRAICLEATRHSQGYLLLPAGEFVGHPIGRMWTTNGYLQCDHVRLGATYPSVAMAADALLRAVTTETETDVAE